MKPLLRDEAGTLRPDLPRPSSRDDAALTEAAVGEWKLLKRQVAEVARVQALRLEQAMVTGRRWKAAELESLLVHHPLLTHLVRLLVWGTYGGDGSRPGDLPRHRGSHLRRPGRRHLRSPSGGHGGESCTPCTWTRRSARRGASCWATTRWCPPSRSSGRPQHRLEGDEARGTVITRFEEIDVPARTLVFTLEKLGWVRGVPEDAGVFHFHTRAFPGAGVTAVGSTPKGSRWATWTAGKTSA